MHNMFDENAEHGKFFAYFRHSSVPGVNSFKWLALTAAKLNRIICNRIEFSEIETYFCKNN